MSKKAFIENLNFNDESFNRFLEVLQLKGRVRFITYDTETTGILFPIEITQFGGVVQEVTLSSKRDYIEAIDVYSLEYKEIARISKYYQTQGIISADACAITKIIQDRTVNDFLYVNEVKKSKFFKTADDIKKFHVLTNEPYFTKEEWDSINSDYDIDFQVGHNIHKYDYMQVLRDTYGIDVDSNKMFDTMYISIHEKERKKLQGTNLNAEISKLEESLLLKNKKKKTSEYERKRNLLQLERIEEFKKIREEKHDALYDTLLTQELLINFLENKLLKLQYCEIDNNQKISSFRKYEKGDVLYLRTNISENNILSMKDILKFASYNESTKVFIVDKSVSHLYKDDKILKDFNVALEEDKKIKVLRGLQLTLINDNEISFLDALIPNTDAYRRLLPLIKNMEITPVKVQALKKLENDFKLPANERIIFFKSPETPKMLSYDDKMNYFYFNKYKKNEVISTLEFTSYMENYNKDESLKSGNYTSNKFQDMLNEYFKEFKKIDFYFYKSLKLSAFPSLPIIYPKAKAEPKNNDEIIAILRESIKDDWIERDMDTIISMTNIERKKMGKLEIPVEDYLKRIEEEIEVLRVLNDIDFVKYYFLVQSWNQYITYGPGRGSAGGSLIAFLKRITDVNPLHYELLFERFLDESRPDYPDIDLDVKDKYFTFLTLNEKYNELVHKDQDYKNNILYSVYNDEFIDKYIKPEKRFFGKIKALAYSTRKTLLGNALRLFLFPFGIQSKMTKEFDEELTIAENVLNFSQRDEVLALYPIKIFEDMERLVKLFTNYGIHAGGVISFPSHSNCIIPMDNQDVSFFDKSAVENAKMIKMDLLGLSTQVMIDEIKSNVKDNFGEDKLFKNNFSTMLDLKTLQGLESGHTVGTFQVESGGMKKILKSLAPLTMDEIIAAVALFRPGPLGSGAVDDFISSTIEKRRGKYGITQDHLMDIKKWKKLEDYNKEQIRDKYLKIIKKVEGENYDYNKITISVVENLITYESYFESEKFKLPLEKYFKEEQGKNQYYDKIIIENDITNIDDFINKIKELEYKLKEHELLSMIMADTNGVIIYQEQIMKLSTNLAGYTKAESNGIRKAVAKKDEELMKIHKKKLIEGLTTNEDKVFIFNNDKYKVINRIKTSKIEILDLEDKKIEIVNGSIIDNKIDFSHNVLDNLLSDIKEIKDVRITDELATYLWGKIESFGAYAFNKSHSAAYSILTYETQYYKEHFPLIAYTVLLKHVSDKHKMGLIREIKSRGINIQIQSLNENTSANYLYDLATNTIFIPLTYVKNFGNDLIYQLIPIMNEYKPESLEEIILIHGKVSKGIMEKIGSLGIFEDGFSYTTQREWYYLSGEVDSTGKKQILKDLIYDRAFKEVKKANKMPVLKDDSELVEIFEYDDILATLEAMDIIYGYLAKKEEGHSESHKVENIENYEDMEKKLKALVTKMKSKLKLKNPMSAELYERIIKEIKKYNFLFFKKNDYKEIYEKYVSLKKEYSSKNHSKMRVLVEKYTEENNIKGIIKNYTNIEDDRLNTLEQENCYVESGVDIYDTSFVFENSDVLIDIEVEKINNTDIVDVNTLILTEFPLSCDFNKKERKVNYLKVDWQGGSQSRDLFTAFNSQCKNKLSSQAQIGYMSLFEDILEKEFIELSQEEKDKKFWEVYRGKMAKIINSGIDNIILCSKGPKESMLRKTIENTRSGFGFKPQNGEFARIIFKDNENVNGKNIFFMSNLFPYKELNPELFDLSVNNLLKAFGIVNEFTSKEEENFNKLTQLYIDKI